MVLGIYGASGLGTEHHLFANRINRVENRWERIVYVDDDETKAGTVLRGATILTYYQAISEYGRNGIEFVLGIGEPDVKDKVFAKLVEDGCNITNLILQEEKELLTENEILGKGVIVKRNSTIPPYCHFGNNVLVQGSAIMGHNVELGDNVVVSSLAFIGGDTTVGKNTYIGPHSCIRNGLHIGNNAIIGMGAVVTKDVPDNAVMVGNPAKIMRYNEINRVFSK